MHILIQFVSRGAQCLKDRSHEIRNSFREKEVNWGDVELYALHRASDSPFHSGGFSFRICRMEACPGCHGLSILSLTQPGLL